MPQNVLLSRSTRMIGRVIGFQALASLFFMPALFAQGTAKFKVHLGHYGLGNNCATITPLESFTRSADVKFELKCPNRPDTFEATVHVEVPDSVSLLPPVAGQPEIRPTEPFTYSISVTSFKSTYDTSSMVRNYTGEWKVTTWVSNCKDTVTGSWTTNSNTVSGSAKALVCQVKGLDARSQNSVTAGFSFYGPGLFSSESLGFNSFVTVRTFYTVSSTPPAPTAIGHASQRPDTPSDTLFVNDMGQGKTLTCQPRSKSPIEFDVEIGRYLAATESDGKLSAWRDLVRNQVVSDSATLRLAAYNAKLPNASGTAPELDLVTLNGESIMYDDQNTGVINKTAGQWTVYNIKVPIKQLKFPMKPGDGSDPPAPARNRVSISIDFNNTGDTYCLAVDWAQISFGAQAPLMLIHGTNADHTTWDFHIKRYRSPVDYLKNEIGVDFESNIDLVPNGSIEGNGALLKDVLRRETRRRGVKSVHLVTHSKGATDSRYFLSKFYAPTQFKVLSLYSLGTPSQGTILSDFSVEASKAHLFATAMQADPKFSGDPIVVGALNFFIDNIAVNAANSYSPGMAPSDPAREQQRIGPMRRLNQTLKPAPGVPYYSLAGNADSNGNGVIDFSEAEGFLPDFLNINLAAVACNRTYEALGRVRSLELEEVRTGGDQDPERKGQRVYWYTIVRGEVNAKIEPNDLVSTVSSVHCQNPCGFVPLGSTEHPDAIYPYHHSNLKSPELLGVIWDNITSRYKVNQY